MHLKKQISMLITTLLILPLVCILFVPVVYYIQEPNSALMKNYKVARTNYGTYLSDKSWKQIQKFLELKPRDTELLAIYDEYVIFSNFADFPVEGKISFEEIFNDIKGTFRDYDYQIQSFYISDNEVYITQEAKLNLDATTKKHDGLLITRRRLDAWSAEKIVKIFMIPLYLVIFVMESVFIVFGIFTIRSISNSVIRLKQATEKIIKGDINTPVDTSLKKGEADEISMVVENLEKMRIALKENAERKTRAIMGISHDLRTPVALIKGYSEAIDDGVLTGDNLSKSAGLINQNAVRLEEMINDLIDYIKLDSAEWKQNQQPVVLKSVLEPFFSNMKGAADLYKRNIAENIDIPDDLTVNMDIKLFQRAMENLFTNALRYTKDGDTISLNSYLNKDGVPVVTIKDTGRGIARENQEKVFELFYRCTGSRREDGMGIGLAVVKAIVESHGWKIDIQSEVGKGTEFIITLLK